MLSENEPEDPPIVDFECDLFPTSDGKLNGHVTSLLGKMSSFRSRMASLLEGLSPDQRNEANALIEEQNLSLFENYPQFDDELLKTGVVEIRDQYAVTKAKFREIYPEYDEER